MFYGQYHHQLDDKGRFRIPTKFREQLGDNPMMMVGLDVGCIMLYRGEDFDSLVQKRFAEADILDLDMGDIMRAIFPLAQEVELDKQGRTAIDKALMQKCGMTKNIVSIGLMNHVEIWDEERYEKHMASLDMKAILVPFSKRN